MFLKSKLRYQFTNAGFPVNDVATRTKLSMREYYVYILTNRSRTLYTGVTSDLEQRVLQHERKLLKGFTSKYNIDMLMWFEAFTDVNQAIESEKRIKGWRRAKKVELIDELNPRWEDLAESWYTNS